jgi:hypothetical protein
MRQPPLGGQIAGVGPDGLAKDVCCFVVTASFGQVYCKP